MKTIAYILQATLLFICLQKMSGQQCESPCGPVPLFVDLSTGVDGGGQKLPLLSNDDDWTVHTPADPTNVYGPVPCGINPGISKPVMWISPYLDPLNGYPIAAPFQYYGQSCGACGNYRYKRNFDLSLCNPQSAELSFDYLGGDNIIDTIKINGFLVNSTTYNFCPTCWDPFYANVTIPVPLWMLHPQGHNEIMIEVWNLNDKTGLIVQGGIKVYTNDFVDFSLRDKNGMVKKDFCVGEDVFLNEDNIRSGNYLITLSKVVGNAITPLAQQGPGGWPLNSPIWLNITNLFSNVSGAEVPNQTYQLSLSINSPCGTLETVKQFRYVCCDNSLDPSFDLNASNYAITANSACKGIHNWNVYSTSNVATGPYTSIGNFNERNFSLIGGVPCYYVEHTVTNACGTLCTAESACNIECPVTECVLSTPANLNYDLTTGVLSWAPVSSAANYVIVITPNICCGDNQVYGPHTITVNAPAVSHPLNFANDLGMVTGVKCFFWTLYAVCPDGTRSAPATQCVTMPNINR